MVCTHTFQAVLCLLPFTMDVPWTHHGRTMDAPWTQVDTRELTWTRHAQQRDNQDTHVVNLSLDVRGSQSYMFTNDTFPRCATPNASAATGSSALAVRLRPVSHTLLHHNLPTWQCTRVLKLQLDVCGSQSHKFTHDTFPRCYSMMQRGRTITRVGEYCFRRRPCTSPMRNQTAGARGRCTRHSNRSHNV